MLQKLREKTSGWIATVILGLLTIPFAFFGVEQYMSRSNETWVAKIEAPPTWWRPRRATWPVSMLWKREEISARNSASASRGPSAAARQQQGENFDPRAFETPENKREILDELIDQRVLRMAAEHAGVAVGDAQVQRRHPRDAGVPGRRQVQPRALPVRWLAGRSRRRPRSSKAGPRRACRSSCCPRALNDSAFVTNSEMDRLLQAARRKARRVLRAAAAAGAGHRRRSAGEEIERWYDSHPAEFRAPETVTIEYVEADGRDLPSPPADEAALRQRYEQEKGKLGGQGQRLASQILVAVPADADAAAQKAAEAEGRASSPPRRRRPGADFAALARANSDDAGSKAKGGDLGWVGKDGWPKPFEDAMFAMQAGRSARPGQDRVRLARASRCARSRSAQQSRSRTCARSSRRSRPRPIANMRSTN